MANKYTLQSHGKTYMPEQSMEMTVDTNNFKRLEDSAVKTHFESLSSMLHELSRFAHEKLDISDAGSDGLLGYMSRLAATLEAIVLKNKIESMRENSDIKISCSIDPTHSGFPLFIRDFQFLHSDKKIADCNLALIPPDNDLVNQALFSLFRGIFPKDIVIQKLAREYYQKLKGLEIPSRFKSYEEIKVNKKEGKILYKKSVERLDEHSNIPRFYNLYFKVPFDPYIEPQWKGELEEAIKRGTSTIAKLELPYLAEQIEEVDGVLLEMLERFDIGPFYNRYTANEGDIKYLIDHGSDNDAILCFQKHYVQRMGEKERKGLGNAIRGFISGDSRKGIFSPPVASPVYALMPHRFIQKVHSKDLRLGENIEMYSMIKGGCASD
ncbi:MAG: hypothetical protein ACMUJM_15525 [bacterium]